MRGNIKKCPEQESLRRHYLRLLEIPVWVEKPKAEKPKAEKSVSLLQLKETVEQCTRCALSKTHIQTVFGRGCETPKIVLVGEAPGKQEDEQGLPFVGRAGQLLTNLLNAMGMSSE